MRQCDVTELLVQKKVVEKGGWSSFKRMLPLCGGKKGGVKKKNKLSVKRSPHYLKQHLQIDFLKKLD